MKSQLLSSVFIGTALCASAVVPTVSNVRIEQDKGSRNVTIRYDLADAPGIVTLDILTNGVSIGAANVTCAIGDVNRKVEAETDREIVWAADRSWPNHKIKTASVTAKVTAWPLNDPPPVMVIDLVNGGKDYTFFEDFCQLEGGVTNRRYKTDYLVMRKVPAKGAVYTMGGTHRIAFTNDFYLGIYEMTQRQMLYLVNDRETQLYAEDPDADVLPSDWVKYGRIGTHTRAALREWENGISQPQGGTVVSSSLIAKIRTYTGFTRADLPTHAQWEFACRAGSAHAYNNGTDDAAGLDAVGWYVDNAEGKPHPVGEKDPNAWGFYDMHGNVAEWVVDHTWASYDPYMIDPPYPPEANRGTQNTALRDRVGGSYVNEATGCKANSLNSRLYNVDDPAESGFRLWIPAEIP